MADSPVPKISTPDWVIAGAGVVLFISLWLPFYKAKVSAAGQSESSSGKGHELGFLAWGGIWIGIIAAIIALIAAFGLMSRFAPQLKLPVGLRLLATALAAVAALLLLIRIFNKPDVPGSLAFLGSGVKLELTRQWGLFLAFLAAVVELVACLMTFRTSGEAVPWQSSGSGPAAPADPPAAPPTA